MEKTRKLYALSSILSLLTGFIIYILFRDLNHLIIFEWIPGFSFLKPVYIKLSESIFSYVLLYNIPDMLWFVSGILLLRFIWYNKDRIQKIYIICFYCIGVLFEISQLSDKVPGTFDFLDLLFMGIGAFVEGLLYNIFRKRRLKHE